MVQTLGVRCMYDAGPKLLYLEINWGQGPNSDNEKVPKICPNFQLNSCSNHQFDGQYPNIRFLETLPPNQF